MKDEPITINELKDDFFFSQKKPLEVFYEKGILKNFAIFTGNHLC